MFSGLWTASRIYTFMLISGERGLWAEFHYWYFGSLFVFLSWTVLYFGIHYYELLILEHQKLLAESSLREKEKLRRLQAESAAREAQLKMLRYQLNPHFLFNTLNAINAHVRLGENVPASEMIQFLSRFLRHSLEQDSTEEVPLEHELESLRLYLKIEKARFGERLDIRYDIADGAGEALVPSLVLQPLVENAMKYAVAPSEEGSTLEIRAEQRGTQLQLQVLDTGPGMVDTALSERKGIGLSNTLERLRALYGEQYEFTVSNRSPKGLVVTIRLPWREAVPVRQAGGMR
jgi:LytS/YehU family sensor histidine kinase